MLNYGYAMLKAKVRGEISAAGFDPTIGFMHGNSSSNIPLVHDLMEPLRPVVDAKILSFVQTHTFSPGDFTIGSFGGCRLNPQMASEIVRQVAGLGGSALLLRATLAHYRHWDWLLTARQARCLLVTSGDGGERVIASRNATVQHRTFFEEFLQYAAGSGAYPVDDPADD